MNWCSTGGEWPAPLAMELGSPQSKRSPGGGGGRLEAQGASTDGRPATIGLDGQTDPARPSSNLRARLRLPQVFLLAAAEGGPQGPAAGPQGRLPPPSGDVNAAAAVDGGGAGGKEDSEGGRWREAAAAPDGSEGRFEPEVARPRPCSRHFSTPFPTPFPTFPPPRPASSDARCAVCARVRSVASTPPMLKRG